MLAALDSSYQAPGPEHARAAAAAGVRIWCGYLATRAGVGLAAPWPQLAFENARLCGEDPIAFVSGRDDARAVRELAAAWRVRPCLDVEDGIRPNGSWVTPWLLESGAGLYGALGVHIGRRAAFHIVALYPRAGDPGAAWPRGEPRPAGLCGWQWQGSHEEFGRQVDRSWLDDGFATAPPPPPWSTGGKMLISYPSDAPEAFGELYVGPDGQCYWGVWVGGAGQFVSYAQELTTLGSPEGAGDLVDCTGCHTVHDGVLRLNVRGIRENGSRWLKVMDARVFGVLQEWTQTPSSPAQLVPAAGAAHRHHVELSVTGDTGQS